MAKANETTDFTVNERKAILQGLEMYKHDIEKVQNQAERLQLDDVAKKAKQEFLTTEALINRLTNEE